MIKSYRRWRLRRAMEQYAYWKGKHDELIRTCQNGYELAHSRLAICQAAGMQALYEERVEFLLREQ